MTFAVITQVRVRPSSIDQLAELFDATNRELVDDQDDWLGALFTANRANNEVTVIARWADAGSYETLRDSPDFQSIMSRFADHFDGAPKVSINEVLVEM